jgi:surface antigen
VYRTRYYRDVVVVRRYGHVYPGYGHYHNDEDAYQWLAFTAITLKILDNLNEAQERAHEQAQLEASRAVVGETIVWNHSGASGAVSVLRDGYSTRGRYCREFQQQVTIGGRSERAYGTACQQPDGSWQVVSTGS